MPVRGKKLGDLMAGRIAQPREGDMRREFAPFGRETNAAQQAFMLRLQFHERREWRDQRDNRARPMSAEGRQPVELDFERLAPDLAEDKGSLARDGLIDIA